MIRSNTSPPTRTEPAHDRPVAAPRRRFHAVAAAALAGGGLAACATPPAGRSQLSRNQGGDWLDSVRIEHRAVDQAFEKLLAAPDVATRTQLRTALADALTLHSIEEETVLYPALAMAGLRTEPQQLFADHAQVKVILAELDVMPKDHPMWMTRVQALRALVTQHVQEEETKIYPAFKASLTPEQNALVTSRYRLEGTKFSPV